MNRFLKGQFQGVLQIRPPTCAGAPAAPSKDIAEDVAEDVAETSRTGTRSSPTGRGIYARMTELVVSRALLRISENFVGFLCLFKGPFRPLVIRISIRMVLHGEAAIGFLEISFGSRAIYTQYLVIIPFRHNSVR